MPRNRPGKAKGDERRSTAGRWPAVAAFLLAACLGIGAPSTLRALPHESEVWIRAETAHFTLFSNVSHDYTREVGYQLELFRHALARLNPDLEMNSPLPTYVFVFRNAQSFGPYKTRFGAGPTSQDAYFNADRDANHIALNATPEGDWLAPVYHEFVHYVLNNNFTDVPLWFNEGLAEYYSTFRLTDEGKAEIGRPVENSVDWLRGNRIMPLTRLFEIEVESPEYSEEDRQGGYYSQAWALVHYLLWGEPEWRINLSDRVARLAAEETLISLVPMRTYGELEKAFTRYVRTGRYRSTLVDFSAAGVTRSAPVTPIDRAELLFRLGDLLARIDSGKEKKAEKHFRESIRIDPSHAGSHAGLGFLRDRDGRREQATPYYEKALTLDPDDYMTTFLYAINLSRIALGEDFALTPIRDEPSAELVRSRELFRRSLALRPGLAEAYAGLGATYIVEADDFQDGIDALETARRLLPSRMDIIFHLMQLYARGGRRDEAQRLMDDVFDHHAAPARIAMARDMLLQADMMQAHRMIEEGRHEEGVAALEELRAASDNPKMQRAIEAEIARVQAWLKNNDEVVAHNRQVALFNEAVRKTNDQDLDGAAAILEKLLPDVMDAELREQARDLLRRIKKAMGE